MCHFCSQKARLASQPNVRGVRKNSKNRPIMCPKDREAGISGGRSGHGLCNQSRSRVAKDEIWGTVTLTLRGRGGEKEPAEVEKEHEENLDPQSQVMFLPLGLRLHSTK